MIIIKLFLGNFFLNAIILNIFGFNSNVLSTMANINALEDINYLIMLAKMYVHGLKIPYDQRVAEKWIYYIEKSCISDKQIHRHKLLNMLLVCLQYQHLVGVFKRSPQRIDHSSIIEIAKQMTIADVRHEILHHYFDLHKEDDDLHSKTDSIVSSKMMKTNDDKSSEEPISCTQYCAVYQEMSRFGGHYYFTKLDDKITTSQDLKKFELPMGATIIIPVTKHEVNGNPTICSCDEFH